MTTSADSRVQKAHVAAAVRRNVWPAAIAALLMCYFGYYRLAVPDVTDLFFLSSLVFIYTLRIGVVLMAAIAIWCWSGRLAALAVDGVVSMLIGVIFVLSGGGMLMDGGEAFNAILILVFGMMFFTAGRRNWRVYSHLAQGGRIAVHDDDDMLVAPVVRSSERSPSPEVAPVASEPVIKDVDVPPHATTEQTAIDTENASEAPPEGFLAAMAKKPPPSE